VGAALLEEVLEDCMLPGYYGRKIIKKKKSYLANEAVLALLL
jgi:hypothetical protein